MKSKPKRNTIDPAPLISGCRVRRADRIRQNGPHGGAYGRSSGEPFIEAVERRVLLAAPAVAPTNAILYVGEDSGLRIHYVLPDGSADTVIPTAVHNIVSAAFNPAHTQVVFVNQSDTDVLNSQEIFIVNADGTGEKQLTDNVWQNQEPQFSPDGSKIVFVSNRDGNDELYVMNADGSNQTRLTTNSWKDEEPTFSPDGSKILFASNQLSGVYHLFTIDAATGLNLTQLTQGSNDFASDPAYSADGSRIAFTSARDNGSEVFVMDSAGEMSGPAATQISFTDANSDDQHPSFSPDGLRLVYIHSDQSGIDMRTVDADNGSEFDDVTYHGGGFIESIQWSAGPQFGNISFGVLKVNGTADGDNITLHGFANTLTVTLNGTDETFPLDKIQSIQVFCGAGNDVLMAQTGTPAFYASGDAGDDFMVGGAGNDTLTGGAGRNTLFGGDGDDRLNGSGGRDFIYGENGNDRIYGNGGNDYLVGGAGVDRMWGGDGDDLISGNSGNDKMFGEAGNDQLLGGDGNDLVYGGLGIDTLNGGKGTDSADNDAADLLISIEVLP